MKLRNKKTGQIIEPWIHNLGGKDYNSLAELNEDWEDYKEPKEYWYYDTTKNGVDKIMHLEDKEKDQAIDNCFETEEEAEKAVEKLKALKRLKDKGFKFSKWTIPEEPKTTHIKLVLYAEMEAPDSPYDLDLLFGGEE